MTPEDLPVVGRVFELGAEDRVLDLILLLGPVVVLVMVVLGRNVVTELLVALYVAAFVVYVPYLAVTGGTE